MRNKVSIFLLAVVLFPCAVNAQHKVIRSCPSLPADLPIQIVGARKLNYWSCEAVTRKNNVVFDIYIGSFPNVPDGLRYLTTTTSQKRNLVWLYKNLDTKQSKRVSQIITLIPTGDSDASVAMVTFQLRNNADFDDRAALVAQLNWSK